MSIEKLKDIIEESDNIVFFGGAGVSTESNIPDFRSEAGLYNSKNNYGYSIEEMLSHSFFMRHTEEFYDFYRSKMLYRNAEPNAAHIALKTLEQKGKLKAVITQNIDGLHQKAGSKNVLELHGSVHRNYCMNCRRFFDLDYIISSEGIPRCACGGIIKPHVVLYEEALDDNIVEASLSNITRADVLVIGGTSLSVYPAAGLINYYKGKHLILINKEATAFDNLAELVIYAPIAETLMQLV